MTEPISDGDARSALQSIELQRRSVIAEIGAGNGELTVIRDGEQSRGRRRRRVS